jgi:hypothetical protein
MLQVEKNDFIQNEKFIPMQKPSPCEVMTLAAGAGGVENAASDVPGIRQDHKSPTIPA